MEDKSGIGQTYLCWGSCYQPGVLTAKHIVAAGGQATFNGHCMFVDSNGDVLPIGTEIHMVYTFFDERNPEEKYTFVVDFKYDPNPEEPGEEPEEPGEDPEEPGDGEDVSELTSSFLIYPNPVNDKLYIETEVEVREVEVYDVFGRQQITVNRQQSSCMDVTSLNSGVYFVKVITDNGEVVKRFVKK